MKVTINGENECWGGQDEKLSVLWKTKSISRAGRCISNNTSSEPLTLRGSSPLCLEDRRPLSLGVCKGKLSISNFVLSAKSTDLSFVAGVLTHCARSNSLRSMYMSMYMYMYVCMYMYMVWGLDTYCYNSLKQVRWEFYIRVVKSTSQLNASENWLRD